MPPKKAPFWLSPSENLFLENEASDVNSRTDFPAITVKSTHFLQPADLLSLFIDCVMYAIHEASAEYLRGCPRKNG